MRANCFNFLWMTCVLVPILASCLGAAPTQEVQNTDLCNDSAYALRYTDLDASWRYTARASEEARFYTDGKAEALNGEGFYKLVKMDFNGAERCFRGVYDLSKNELELLVADVGLMKIYQRTANNKGFYDSRNSALRHMERINEDKSVFAEPREIRRLNFAFSEFHIVSAIYHFYLNQQEDARKALVEVKVEELKRGDRGQFLYYQYIRAAIQGYDRITGLEAELKSFDELFDTWLMAKNEGYAYFEANALQEIAALLVLQKDREYLCSRREFAMRQLGLDTDSINPKLLADRALRLFKEYGDPYQRAGCYVTIASVLNYRGRYREALDTLQQALNCVNEHHRTHYASSDSLASYVPDSDAYVEMEWLENNRVTTVPEWILQIREQLCVSYAGLGMKPQSDYNRNIYLDVLNEIRQDKELENRYERLERKEKELDVLIVILLVGLVFVSLFFVVLNRKSRRRSNAYTLRLEHVLRLCREIVAHIPMEQEVIQAELDLLFGAGRVVLDRDPEMNDNWRLTYAKHLRKEDRALMRLIQPYLDWASGSEVLSEALSDERVRLEKEKYIFQKHIAVNKRQNVVKKSCLAIVNGITPYLDRMLNEVHKLKNWGYVQQSDIKYEKYDYIDELAAKINEYNDILALWIKLKQGAISLKIETFALNDLFSLVEKGHRTFDVKGQRLDVVPAPFTVKADKALTLFMINTLAENARKYTPQGGMVRLEATEGDGFVEVSVSDTGYGMSQEDIHRILDEKVYDSQKIGNDSCESEHIRANKGSGFGLMNCKGIIEKYRKTNALFQVCLFGIESEPGKGSRFYFRLPKGLQRTLSVALVVLGMSVMASCGGPVAVSGVAGESDSTDVDGYEQLLDVASDFADEAYYANLEHRYHDAVSFVDSARCYLNAHHALYGGAPNDTLSLVGADVPVELLWWQHDFTTDYHVILDIRNEAAVAFLALKQWEAYDYNNKAYTLLYKLQSEDWSLEEYCRQLKHSTTNKIVGIALCLILAAALLIGYYWTYVRRRIGNRIRLEQVFDINRAIFDATAVTDRHDGEEALQREEETLRRIPKRIVEGVFAPFNEVFPIEKIDLTIYSAVYGGLILAEGEGVFDKERISHCFERGEWMADGDVWYVPLMVETDSLNQKVGVLAFQSKETIGKQEMLLLELVVRYISVLVLNSVLKTANQYRDIESAHEEVHRAMWEDNQIHVQNMVLDNCLSSIKHETVYYPNRIRQIVGRLREGKCDVKSEMDQLEAVTELVEYYKGVFAILSSCASRQLEEVTFRRTVVPVNNLLDYARRYAEKAIAKTSLPVTFVVDGAEGAVVCDRIQLEFLLESLVNEALGFSASGEIRLRVRRDDGFFYFHFCDIRRKLSDEEVGNLFYPDLQRMEAEERGERTGSVFLICKQIIREHDEFAGRRGCRIEGRNADGCFEIMFSVPAR